MTIPVMCISLSSCMGFYQVVDPTTKSCDILGRIANQEVPTKYTYTNRTTNNYYYKGQTTETIKVEKNTYKEVVDFDNRNFYTYSLIDTGDQYMKIETWGLTKGCTNFFVINIDDEEKTFRALTPDEFNEQILQLKVAFKERFDPVAFLRYLQLFTDEEYLLQSKESYDENCDVSTGSYFTSKGRNSIRSMLYKNVEFVEEEKTTTTYDETITETDDYWIINYSHNETTRVSSNKEKYKTILNEERKVDLNSANIKMPNLDEYKLIS